MMRFRSGSASRRNKRAIGLLLCVLVVAPSVHANSSPGTAEAIATPAGDDREDDVTAFFQSGEYKKHLSLPLITIGLLSGLAAVAGLAGMRWTL